MISTLDFYLYEECKEILENQGFIQAFPGLWVMDPYHIELKIQFLGDDFLAVTFESPQLQNFPLCVENRKHFFTFVKGIKNINRTFGVR